MKKVKVVKIVFGVIIFLLGFWVGEKSGYFVYKKITEAKARKNAQILEEAILKAEGYRKDDVYGGKTPQETYEMFVSALKKGDVELASRYFVGKRQKEELDYLSNLERSGKLIDLLNNLPSWGNLTEVPRIESDKKQYKALGKGEILFEKNINDIWKISFL